MPIADILELYARVGRSLQGNGLKEAALPAADGEAALRLFAYEKWRVLGGDVYKLTARNELEPTYENWAYQGEDIDESIEVASDFVRGLVSRPVFIVFVIASRGC